MTRPRRAPVPVAAVLSLLAFGALLVALARRRLRRVEVAGDSMLPGLAPGDFLLLRRGAPAPDRAAGAIVAFEAPRSPGLPERPELLLKRIVGLPAEMLRVGAQVEINGRVLVEPYRHGVAPEHSYRGVHAVPPRSYFVLGDARGQSTDSREFGAIEAERILGAAIWRYWPPRRFGAIRRQPRVWTTSGGG
jgi:signal peptidase I